MDYHNDFTIPLDILKNKETKILHSIVSCENRYYNSSLIVVDNNTEQFIHCWDGNDFFELTSFKYPQDILNNCNSYYEIVGMEIIGRRYNIYFCGGKFDYEIFNKNIWRYSLISKKWFLETTMPTERWCMTAAFVKNKLILVGGFGKSYEYPENVDIYDIYTGLWTSGAKPPCHFGSCNYTVLDEKLIVFRKFLTIRTDINYSENDYESYNPKCKIYIYFSNMNVWKMVSHGYWKYNPYVYGRELIDPIIFFKTAPCYLEIVGRNIFLRVIKDSCNKLKNKQCVTMRYKSRIKFKLGYKKSNVENSILHFLKKNWLDLYLHSYDHNYKTDTCIAYLDLTGSCYKNIHIHSFPIKDTQKFQSCFNGRNKFFSINDPNYLYN
ncbi:PREDICTED: uncharacterized protein LOC105153611 [Acromyrmex echinatior]|uniref:uncharacterized protein LOC105153611 n=1 Tax=Acromyrmex echinatior TaxID=103372 RepID=UPI000580E319|nr:PREDICTED: uncharacterized protein LOC105153611 [Acromyrmex echinatior]